ncbi:MAG: C13 family peptidase [Paracraurococcus sp.]
MRAWLGHLALLLVLAGCAPSPPYTGPTYAPEALTTLRYRAVLVAGDPSLEVWDRAVERLASGLEAGGTLVPSRLTRMTARVDRQMQGAEVATYEAVIGAIRTLRPAPGEGCLVYLTMHGVPRDGLVLIRSRRALGPDALDAALAEGCGDAPSFVVASGCYSGGFADGVMARQNRVVLTASRSDLSSFGCGTRFELTVFDACMIASLGKAPPLAQALVEEVRGCVDRAERRLGAPASYPQAHIGTAVPGLVPRFGAGTGG